MTRLSLFKKLIFANALYSVPVVALIYLMVAAQNVNIDFGLQEEKGNLLQRPVERMLEAVSYARFDHGSGDQHMKEAAKQISEYEKALSQVGEDLQFTKEGLEKRKRGQVEIQAFKGKLETAASRFSSLSLKERTEVTTQIIADLRTIITHSGDTSNLILDPDLDSYYLMDISLLALPQTQDRISEILNYISQLNSKTVSNEEKTALAVYRALLKQADVDRIAGDLQTSLNEDANFYGESPSLKSSLEPAINEFVTAAEGFGKQLDVIISEGRIADVSNTMAQGEKALKASYKAWHVSADELDKLLDNRVSILKSARTRSLALSLVALIFAVAVLFWISNSFNKNMKQVIESLKVVVSETKTAGDDLVHLSEQLSTVSTDQAAAIQQTASAVSEIESMTKSTLSHVTSSKDLSEESDEKARVTFESVRRLSEAISDISESNTQVLNQVDQSRREMEEVTKIIGQIGAKTKVINEIVFQTKLLSFNASVEAARAGEAGKGFAVVAEEVGNLAQMSGTSSKEISDILGSSIDSVTAMSENTKQKIQTLVGESREKIEIGTTLASECSTAIEDIQHRIRSVVEASMSIVQAANEQTKGIEEISQALNRIDQLSQQSMAMSKQTAEQSRVLARQAVSLNEVANVVQSVVMGTTEEAHEGANSKTVEGHDEDVPRSEAA